MRRRLLPRSEAGIVLVVSETGERVQARVRSSLDSVSAKGWTIRIVEVEGEVHVLQIDPSGRTNHPRYDLP